MRAFFDMCSYFALEITMLIIGHFGASTTFEFFLILYAIPLFICSMRYQQKIAYIYLVQHRYRLINEFVEEIHLAEPKEFLKPSLEKGQIKFIEPYQAERTKESTIENDLQNVRRAQRLLFEATNSINDQFYLSTLLNIGNDVQKALVNFYFAIMNFSIRFHTESMILPLCWATYNFKQIVMLTTACESAVHEV